jgi:geranylgeranyl pyrophosphate synthase
MRQTHTLQDFVARVHERLATVVAHPSFHPTQVALLDATLARVRPRALAQPLGDPLSVTYLVARAHGRPVDAQMVHVGAFCALYVLSLDLFDDVQDDDLAGKPHAVIGAPIAINDAITLLFLALEELRAAISLEGDEAVRAMYPELFGRVSLRAVSGQHRDLLGAPGALTPDEVLAMQEAKTSSVSLLAECGALLGGADVGQRAHYRALGEALALFIQVRDDLRDIFGKELSPDLATGKVSYPVACLLETGTDEERAELARLAVGLPGSMPALRDLFYRSGAVERSAETLERLREQIHGHVAATHQDAATLRLLLDVVDGLAASVYAPPPLEATRALREPTAGWHARVRAEQARFLERMAPLGSIEAPALRPWHLPHWMYVPATHTIHYPDLEGLGDEALPFQAWLLDEPDLDRVAAIVAGQAPLVMAHEMFHAWRHVSGRMTEDAWHEEWAANVLSVAYGARFEPAALASSVALARDVVARFPEGLGQAGHAALARCEEPGPCRGYELDLLEVAVVGLEMVRRLAEAPKGLEATLAAVVGPMPAKCQADTAQ